MVKREIELQEMSVTGQDSHRNILVPKYILNSEIKVYEEIEVPPKSLYKAVGYNDM